MKTIITFAVALLSTGVLLGPVAEAARIGEHETYRAGSASARQQALTPEQAYQQHLGDDDFGGQATRVTADAD